MFENWTLNYRNCDLSCTTDYYVDAEESYNNPNVQNVIMFSGQSAWKIGSSTTVQTYPTCYITSRVNDQWRVALYITTTGDSKAYLTCLHRGGGSASYGVRWSYKNNGGTTYYDVSMLPDLGYDYWSGSYATNKTFTFSTNIPFFGTDKTHAQEYVNSTDDAQAKQLLKTYAYNYKEDDVSPDGEYFEINNMWTHGVWLNDTQPQVNGSPNYRSFRGKMTDGTFALYKIDGIDNGKLKMGINNNASFVDMEYTTDGITWVATDTFPFDFFYRKRVNELGEFDYALAFSNSKIPIFADEETAQSYIDGDIDITQADNWADISQNYPIINNTADSDDVTVMGEVFTKSFFSQQYICSEGTIQAISNALFDITQGGITGMWENIKKGLEMYGEASPISAVQSCMFFPIDLTQVYTNTSSQTYIYFGGYKFDLPNGESVNKIVFPNGHYDFGTFHISSSFGGSFRDYSPYQRVYCYLPYIGWTELDTARYIEKDVKVWYYFDTRTGMCLACVFTLEPDGWCLQDYFNGQCGVSMPITLTDFSAYANAQIQTLISATQKTTYEGNAIGEAGAGFMQGLAESGAIGVGSMSLGIGAVGVGIGATKALYGLTQNNINNFNKTKGSSSSMLNMCLPQEVCFMIETQEAMITPNELSLMGYPSNASGKLCDFSGYLEVDTVNLVCPYATENEKAEIIAMLKSGVYI